MASEAGKGDGQRPGKGYQEGHERIYGEQKRVRWIPPPLPEFARVGQIGVVGARLAVQVGQAPANEDKERGDEHLR